LNAEAARPDNVAEATSPTFLPVKSLSLGAAEPQGDIGFAARQAHDPAVGDDLEPYTGILPPQVSELIHEKAVRERANRDQPDRTACPPGPRTHDPREREPILPWRRRSPAPTAPRRVAVGATVEQSTRPSVASSAPIRRATVWHD